MPTPTLSDFLKLGRATRRWGVGYDERRSSSLTPPLSKSAATRTAAARDVGRVLGSSLTLPYPSRVLAFGR